MLPKNAIQEFKRLYEKRYGVKLTDEEASSRASNLVSLYAVVYERQGKYNKENVLLERKK